MFSVKKNTFKISLLLFSFIFLFIANNMILAADSDFDFVFDEGGFLKETTEIGSNDPASIAFTVVNYSLVILGTISFIIVLIGGFMWMFAMGEEEKIKQAQGILKGAFWGLLVIMMSVGATQYIFTKIVEITN